jgi:hypothetical protein
MSGGDSKMEPTTLLALALPDNACGKIHEHKKLQAAKQSEFYFHKTR